jgi:hypothetical protein
MPDRRRNLPRWLWGWSRRRRLLDWWWRLPYRLWSWLRWRCLPCWRRRDGCQAGSETACRRCVGVRLLHNSSAVWLIGTFNFWFSVIYINVRVSEASKELARSTQTLFEGIKAFRGSRNLLSLFLKLFRLVLGFFFRFLPEESIEHVSPFPRVLNRSTHAHIRLFSRKIGSVKKLTNHYKT